MKHKVKCRPLLSAARGGSPPPAPLATPLSSAILFSFSFNFDLHLFAFKPHYHYFLKVHNYISLLSPGMTECSTDSIDFSIHDPTALTNQ